MVSRHYYQCDVNNEHNRSIHFSPMLHFCTSCKRQKNSGKTWWIKSISVSHSNLFFSNLPGTHRTQLKPTINQPELLNLFLVGSRLVLVYSWSVLVGYKTRANVTILRLKQNFALKLKVDLSNMQGYLFTKEKPLLKKVFWLF